VGLYERLIEERTEEEQRWGERLPPMRGLNSKVLARRLEDAPAKGRPGYTGDLLTMHRLITRGPRSAAEGMRGWR
jgi:hypothetical protein